MSLNVEGIMKHWVDFFLATISKLSVIFPLLTSYHCLKGSDQNIEWLDCVK